MRKLYFLIFLCFVELNVIGQKNVVPIQEVKNVNGGIIYSLPKTVLEINIRTTKTYKVAGPYAQYAKEYFGIEDSEVIKSNSESIEISRIYIQTKGKADPERTYFVTTCPKSTFLIQKNEGGIIAGVNALHEEETNISTRRAEKENLKLGFDKSDLSEEYFFADSDEKAADIVASQIYAIRESRMDLLSGVADYAPADGASMQIMLNELRKKETSLMQLFIGKIIRTTETETIELSPKENSNKNVLFYFSAQKGISTKEDINTKPVYISLNANKKEFFQLEKKDILKPTKQGLVYCLPGSADIEISDANNVYYKGNVNIAQFGTTLSLPRNLLDKKNIKIIFDTTTGDIKSINN